MERVSAKIWVYPATIICLLLSLMPRTSFAAAWAVVEAEKAKIFSDIQMTSVLGYVRKGKKIRVGTVPKNQGRLLPVIVSKKIAYIQVKDIKTGVRLDTLKSVISRITDKINHKSEEKKVGLGIGGELMGAIYSDSDNIANSDKTLMFAVFGGRGYYRNLDTGSGYKFSLNYQTQLEEGVRTTIISVPFAMRMYEEELFKSRFTVYAGPMIVPFFQLSEEKSNLFKINGQGLGGEVSAEWVYSLRKNIDLHIDTSFHIYKLLNLELVGVSINPWVYAPKVMGAITYSY